MEIKNQNLIAALKYHDMGLSVIPVVYRSKKSLVKWEQYQTDRASREQVEQWFKNSEINVGIVTGGASGVVVIDIDTTEKIDRPLPQTVTARTGRGGWHLFYKHPGRYIKTRADILPRVDIRGDGGIVVMPPSLHENGNRYRWEISPEKIDFADLPKWVLETEKTSSITEINNELELITKVVEEGKRNDAATRISGKLLAMPQEFWTFGWFVFQEWNRSQCKPPLEEKELRTVWESIQKREQQKEGNFLREFSMVSLSELLSKEFGELEWIVDRLIPKDAITFITGAPASFKTWLMLNIALKVSAGENLFDVFPTTQSAVLVIDEENGERLLYDRIKKLSALESLPVHFISLQKFFLTDKNVRKIIEVARSIDAKLIMFDSFVRIHGSDENDAIKMAAVSKHLKEFSKNGISVIITHHNRKQSAGKSAILSQEIRGSSDILAFLDCHIAVERKKDGYLTLTQTKLRQGEELSPFKLNIVRENGTLRFEYAGHLKEKQNKRGEIKITIQKILEELNNTPNRKELWALVKETGTSGGEATFKTAIKEMVEVGGLFTKKGAKNSTLYSLKEFGTDG